MSFGVRVTLGRQLFDCALIALIRLGKLKIDRCAHKKKVLLEKKKKPQTGGFSSALRGEEARVIGMQFSSRETIFRVKVFFEAHAIGNQYTHGAQSNRLIAVYSNAFFFFFLFTWREN